MTVTDEPQDVYTPEVEWYDDQIGYFVRHRGMICHGCPGDVWVLTQVIWDTVSEIGCGETRVERDGQNQVFMTCWYDHAPRGGFITYHTHPFN